MIWKVAKQTSPIKIMIYLGDFGWRFFIELIKFWEKRTENNIKPYKYCRILHNYEDERRIRMKLRQKILLGIVSLFCLFGLSIYTAVNYQVNKVVNGSLLNELASNLNLGYKLIDQMYPGDWHVEKNNLYKGKELINNNTQAVDIIKEQTGALATIFLGDTRVSTNVTLEDGKRAVGTKAAQEVVAKVLRGGQDFIGEANVVGKKFLTRYTPIRSKEGKVIGMWFIGVEKDRAKKIVGDLNKLIGLIIFAGIVIGILASSVFTRYILKPIPYLLVSFNKASHGDLTVETPVISKDEIGGLAQEFNQMLEKQRESMLLVRDAANRISDNSSQISMGNEDLSQRTQEQASTLEELSAMIEEMGASIQLVAANSERGEQLSQATLNAVQEGREAVVETIKAMEEISASSNQIAEIIKVVNDIAFQTNLLALNAAVEAARAGEQGRGFAVVAVEVRNLAGRTAESAREIESLINESVSRVENGNQMAKRSGEALNLIVENTKQTSDVIMEVAAAMREQAETSLQIQTSIEQLNQVTQQNAAMVQELASSSQALNTEAESLRDLVKKFTVGDYNTLAEKKQNKRVEGNPRKIVSERVIVQDSLGDF